ncbi:hypothetical protein [Cryobacterium adonitolivorans]|nr:hypothetical protein [Cryobacterium adonitolivorans]
MSLLWLDGSGLVLVGLVLVGLVVLVLIRLQPRWKVVQREGSG